MDSHELPPLVYLLLLGGAAISIIALVLFLLWSGRRRGQQMQPRLTPGDGRFRRKKGGRKRYR